MAADAEGASKVVRIRVIGATDVATARQVGRAIADSGLVRASFFGADPNWGRILAAAGTCPVEVDSIAYEDVVVYRRTGALSPIEGDLAWRLKGDFSVTVALADGEASVEVITTDLTPDYVSFNGEPS
jgi:glutamate N-acetyltransferase/amino-acid N-acetyltransferase